MARRHHIALYSLLLVALAHGTFAATQPADGKSARQPPHTPAPRPTEQLKPEAAPQQLGLLLPTGGSPGLAMMGLPTAAAAPAAAAATDPRSSKPVAALPAFAAPQPAALPGAFPGALPSMAAPMAVPRFPAAAATATAAGAYPAAAGGYPAAAGGYPAAAGGYPAAAGAYPAAAGGYPAAAGGFPAAANPAGYPPLAPGFPAAATPGPLLMPAALQAMPAPMLPTSLPGDGVMGHGGIPVIPGVTPTAGLSGSDMAGSGSYDSAFGSSVESIGMGSGIGSNPISATTPMAGSGTLGASATGTLGKGANNDASQALRSRRAAMSSAGSRKLANSLAGVALLACVLLL